MSGIVNIPFAQGYGPPLMRVTTANGGDLGTYAFPQCTKDGFSEKHIPKMKIKDIIDGTTIWSVKGWKVEFTMNYNSWITGDTLFLFKTIIDLKAANDTVKVYLTPRSDNLPRFYEVYYTGEPIDLGILKGGKNAIGNYKPVIRWKTIKRFAQFQASDPNDINVSLDNFVTL